MKNSKTQKKIEGKDDLKSYFSMLSKLIASYNEQDFDRKNPLLSGTLPTGERIQIVGSPCANNAISIRKPTCVQFSLEDYKKNGAFESTVTTGEKKID